MLCSAKLERVGTTGVSGDPTDGVVDEVAGDDVEDGDGDVKEWRHPG